jgi:hypothetical protein
MGGKSTLRTRQKALDRVFGEWIRRRDADDCEMVHCITCTAIWHYKDTDHINAGHFWKRQHQGTRYDPRNCHGQCVSCNKYRGGAEAEHAAYIIREYGLEVFEELERRHTQIKKWQSGEIEELIALYKQKLAALG